MKTEESNYLKNRKILVIVTGSIAAVKTPILVSNLIKEGAAVRCVVTKSASRLVSPLSLATLSRNVCYQDIDQWNPHQSKPLHIDLAEWADLVLVAPLSASSLSRWVNGLGEGLAASLLIACEKPIIAAAAMNTAMWSNSAVKENWNKLKCFQNLIALSPSEGLLACDRIGDGRMINIEVIKLALESTLIQIKKTQSLEADLNGLNILVTAGATIEDLDPTRFISNRSSGLMGVLIAQAAKLRGAEVELVHGPLQVSSNLLEGINTFKARSGLEMQKIIKNLQPKANLIAMSAAITDLRRKGGQNEQKLDKKHFQKSLPNSLELVPDILSELITNKRKNQIVLGFTALTGNDDEIKKITALKKATKGCDLIFANPIDRSGQGLDSPLNGGWLSGPNETMVPISTDSKLSIAHLLLDELIKLLNHT